MLSRDSLLWSAELCPNRPKLDWANEIPCRICIYTNICAHICHQYDIAVQRSVKDSSLFTRIWTTLTSYICLGVYKRSATPHRRRARCPTKPNADYFGTLEARPNICLSAPHLLIHGPINFTHQENVKVRNKKIFRKVALEIHRPISAFAPFILLECRDGNHAAKEPKVEYDKPWPNGYWTCRCWLPNVRI